MEPEEPRRTPTGLLEERLEIREKLKVKRMECDRLRDRYEEAMEQFRGLEISLRCAEKGRDELEARLAIIDRTLKTEFEDKAG